MIKCSSLELSTAMDIRTHKNVHCGMKAIPGYPLWRQELARRTTIEHPDEYPKIVFKLLFNK